MKKSVKKTAWKIYKIALFVIAPFSLSLLGSLIFPSEAELLDEQVSKILNRRESIEEMSSSDFLRKLYLEEEEYKSKFTSDTFATIVFGIWGLFALFFIVRGIIRWVARTAAAAVKETKPPE